MSNLAVERDENSQQEHKFTWPFNLPPESFAFLTGKYGRAMKEMDDRVAVSNAREKKAETTVVYLRQNDITGDLIVSKKKPKDKIKKAVAQRKKEDPKTQRFTLSDGKKYTRKEIAAIAGISTVSAFDRVKDGCRDAAIVLRPRDENKVNIGVHR